MASAEYHQQQPGAPAVQMMEDPEMQMARYMAHSRCPRYVIDAFLKSCPEAEVFDAVLRLARESDAALCQFSAQLHKVYDEAAAKANAYEGRIQQLTSQIDSIQKERSCKAENVSKLEDELNQQRQLVEAAVKEKESVASRAERARRHLVKAAKIQAKKMAANGKALASLREELARVRDERAKTVSAFNEKLTAAQNESAQVKRDLAAASARNTKIVAELTSARAKLEVSKKGADSKSSENADQLSACNLQLSLRRKEIELLQREKSELETERKLLGHELARLKENLADLTARNVNLAKELNEKENSFNAVKQAADDQANKFVAELEHCQKAFEALQCELEQARSSQGADSSTITTACSGDDSATTKNLDSSNDDSLRSEVTRLAVQNARLTSGLMATVEELNKVRETSESAVATASAESTKRVAELEDENNRLVAQLREMFDEFSRLVSYYKRQGEPGELPQPPLIKPPLPVDLDRAVVPRISQDLRSTLTSADHRYPPPATAAVGRRNFYQVNYCTEVNFCSTTDYYR